MYNEYLIAWRQSPLTSVCKKGAIPVKMYHCPMPHRRIICAIILYIETIKHKRCGK